MEVLRTDLRDKQLPRMVHEAKACGCPWFDEDQDAPWSQAPPELLHEGVARLLAADLHLHVGGNDQVQPLRGVVQASPPLHRWQIQVGGQVLPQLCHVLRRLHRNRLLKDTRPHLLRCGEPRGGAGAIIHDVARPEVRHAPRDLVEHTEISGPSCWVAVGHIRQRSLRRPEHLEELVPALLLVRNSKPPYRRIIQRGGVGVLEEVPVGRVLAQLGQGSAGLVIMLWQEAGGQNRWRFGCSS
mmetsp:Transcript_84717/g.262314  ORF Transcript_84717/g.262314 Transcript_84717/m.262314 type:complete len:241 (-) Transcript_84717:351-1073(-)